MKPGKRPKPIILRRLSGLIILRLLCENKMHGYDIWKKLEEAMNLKIPHPIVYRILRDYEAHGLVKSDWVYTESGPAKKIYEITEDGIFLLKNNLEYLKKLRDILAEIVDFIEEKLKAHPT